MVLSVWQFASSRLNVVKRLYDHSYNCVAKCLDVFSGFSTKHCYLTLFEPPPLQLSRWISSPASQPKLKLVCYQVPRTSSLLPCQQVCPPALLLFMSKTSPMLAILPTSIFPSVSPIVYISIFAILLGIVPTWGSASHLRQCVTKCLNLVVCKPVTQWVDKHFSFTPRPIYCQVSPILPAMARQPAQCLKQCLHLYFNKVLQSVSTFSPLPYKRLRYLC